MPEALGKMMEINWGNLFRKCKSIHMDSICYPLPFRMRLSQYTSEYSGGENIYKVKMSFKNPGRIVLK